MMKSGVIIPWLFSAWLFGVQSTQATIDASLQMQLGNPISSSVDLHYHVLYSDQLSAKDVE